MEKPLLSSKQKKFLEVFKELQEENIKKIAIKRNEIQKLWNSISSLNTVGEKFRDFHRAVHSTNGVSATFGMISFSEKVQDLEDLLIIILDKKKISQQNKDSIKRFIDDFVEYKLEDDLKGEEKFEAGLIRETKLLPITEKPKKLSIWILSFDEEEKKYITEQFRHYDFSIIHLNSIENLIAQWRVHPPQLLIVDISVTEQSNEFSELIKKTEVSMLPDILFLSDKDTMELRIEGVRNSGTGFIPRPIDIGVLINSANNFLLRGKEAPFRVLIIEDDTDIAVDMCFILEQAGMTTSIIMNPLNAIRPLIELRPDLILLDLYMKHCTGFELAEAIRQQPAYTGVPIIFVSSEKRPSQKLEAMRLGADDFLTKPVSPEVLINTVRIRAQRARSLRNFMEKDSLTKLFNHVLIKQRLKIEVTRASRHQKDLSFVMIDIDNFKNVNDSYGHLVGDQVLMTLSSFLKNRLRTTDILGRYGGEEFAVILTDCPMKNAIVLMNEVRENFAKIEHRFGKDSFKVTLSMGIASFPQFTTAESLNERADQALYAAKDRGRNKVVASKRL